MGTIAHNILSFWMVGSHASHDTARIYTVRGASFTDGSSVCAHSLLSFHSPSESFRTESYQNGSENCPEAKSMERKYIISNGQAHEVRIGWNRNINNQIIAAWVQCSRFQGYMRTLEELSFHLLSSFGNDNLKSQEQIPLSILQGYL